MLLRDAPEIDNQMAAQHHLAEQPFFIELPSCETAERFALRLSQAIPGRKRC